MKYDVMFKVVSSVIVEIEAESENEARELAENEMEIPTLCHHCASHVDLCDEGEIIGITLRDDSPNGE